MKNKILLDFVEFTLTAKLFDTKIAQKFYNNLPYEITLTTWGNEAYGSIGIDLGKENPVPDIPPGGLAYTKKGNYFCIFYGQKPAWPVEFIGEIENNWRRMLTIHVQNVKITKSFNSPPL